MRLREYCLTAPVMLYANCFCRMKKMMPVGSEQSQYMFILRNLINAKFHLLSFCTKRMQMQYKKAGVPCQPGLAKVRRVRYDSA